MSKKKDSDNSGDKNMPDAEKLNQENTSGSEKQSGENAGAVDEKDTVPPVQPPEVDGVADDFEIPCRVLRDTFIAGDQLRPNELILAPKKVVNELADQGAVDASDEAIDYCDSEGVKPRKIGEKKQPKKPAADADAAITE